MYTAKQFEVALQETLAEVRSDIRESWAMEPTAEKREALWHEHKAIERIEEKLRHEFANIIRRAGEPVGGVAGERPGE